MSKLLLLIAKNAVRNKLRTGLTATAVMVLAAVFAIQQAVMHKVSSMIQTQGTQTKILVSERWLIPSEVPVRYLPQLTEIEGVEDWAAWRLYSGYLDESERQDRLALGIATRMDNLRSMAQDLADLPPHLIEAMQRERTGALVGKALMESLGWELGEQFTCRSNSHPGSDLRFKVIGVLPSGVWASSFFFREDYYESGTGNRSTVNYLWLCARDTDAGNRIARRVREEFDGRNPALKVETESAGVARFAKRNQFLFAVINMVSGILVLNMVLILSNSISLSMRERRVEFAVLRALGFRPVHIMTLVIGEAACVGALSGALGAALAWSFFFLGSRGMLPLAMINVTVMFTIPLQIILQAIAISTLVGVVASAVPAWMARKSNMLEAFGQAT